MLKGNGHVQLTFAIAEGQASVFRIIIVVGIVPQIMHINKTENGQLAVLLLVLQKMRDESACFKQLAQLRIGIHVHEQ